MKHNISVPLSDKGIDDLIKNLEEYKEWLKKKTQELVDRLAEQGKQAASFTFDIAVYDGKKDVSVKTEQRGDCVTAVIAYGSTALILEFGAGVTLGYGHPEPMGYGPGTYPGQKHAMDPKGWYLPKDVQKDAGTDHSVGNPPSMAMYNARKELEQDLERIAKEVFSS